MLASLGLHALLFVLEQRPEPRRLWGDEILYADLAERGARGEPAEIELLWPPLYPRLLSLAARVGPLQSEPPAVAPGTRPPPAVGRARLVVGLVQLALLGVAAWALWVVARRLTGSSDVADVATALFVLDPQLAAFAHYLWPETLHLALFLVALAGLLRDDDPGPWSWAGIGLLLGLALLTKSLLQPFLPVLVAPVVARQGWRRAVLVLGVAAAVVTPTLLSNGWRTGTFVVADSRAFNAWVGLNDRAPRNFQDEIVGDEFERWRASAPTFAERNDLLLRRIDALVSERGPWRVLRAQLGRQFYRLFGAPSFFTDQLPGGAIAARGYGYVATPLRMAGLLRAWHDVFYALLLVAAAFGCALVPRLWQALGDAGARRRASGLWLLAAAFVAYNLGVLLVLHVKTRYRVPLLPFFDVVAALALCQALQRGRPAGALPLGRGALASGAVLAALLLKLAFWPPSAG